jgi:asparagine synthase (glutamine-hydrolysing)
MCGIAGFFEPHSIRTRNELESVAIRMAATIAHRGPDDHGVWVDIDEGIALAHRRLSIIDLSPAGHQPMISRSQRYVIIFNGEIYNYRELKSCLGGDTAGPGPVFRGSSDTEIMLAAFDRWGLEAAVAKFNGMFAFAVWDREERTLILGRDRVGEKPLYYGRMGGAFLFGSELKALRAHPAFCGRISRGSLALFLRDGYVPGPYSIYENVWKLPPGTILRIRDNADPGSMNPAPYWSAKDVAEAGLRNPLRLTDDEAVVRLDSLLSDAVRLRMVADVPLGAFLSGGIDSSTVVALMQKDSARPVKTFTLGFREAGWDEAVDAAKVAAHLGCDHTQLYVTPAEAMEVVPLMPTLYDEPFADSSQIPTYIVSRLARQHVTVSLSGDGGDEVFGGYSRYRLTAALWQKIRWLPIELRRYLAKVLAGLPYGVGDIITRSANSLLPASAKASNPVGKLQRLAGLLAADSPEALYYRYLSLWSDPFAVVLGASELPTTLSPRNHLPGIPDFVERMMLLDSITYLPDDILVKVDRASMGVSLESRVPLLDHRIIEFSWQLPLSMKIRDGQGKWLLRQVLYRYVPRELVDRPKAGFSVPIHVWIRGPLRPWAEELLDADRLRREGFFDPVPIRRMWAEHLAGTRNNMYALWNVLMFQAWLEHERAETPRTAEDVTSFV